MGRVVESMYMPKIDFNTYGADYKPEPLSSGRGEEQDLWVMLIEKAFAQVRGGIPI